MILCSSDLSTTVEDRQRIRAMTACGSPSSMMATHSESEVEVDGGFHGDPGSKADSAATVLTSMYRCTLKNKCYFL